MSARSLKRPAPALPASYPVAKAAHDALNEEVKRASIALNAIPGISSGPCGLTPDAVKQTAEFRAAKATYDTAAEALRRFNQPFMRQFKREIAAERRANGR